MKSFVTAVALPFTTIALPFTTIALPFTTIALPFTTIALLGTLVSTPAAAMDTMEWSADSANGAFTATLKSGEVPVPIGQFHEWTVAIVDANDAPVYPATVAVDGGMPHHGHGMPSAPQVTEHLGDGVYRVEGMKFNMMGRWVMTVDVSTEDFEDQAEFEVKLGAGH